MTPRALQGRELQGRALQGEEASAVVDEGPPPDPLSVLDDDFEGTDNLETRGWTLYKSAAVASQACSGGECDFRALAGGGGVGGTTSFWFDGTADGILAYKLVTGDFDARLRCRVRNTANSGNPAVTNFRIAGLAVHDPVRTSNVFNYLHIGAGSAAQAQNRIEWKTTDDGGQASNDTSAFNSAAWAGGNLDVDLRIVRAGQVFTLYYRASSGDLLDDVAAWSTLTTINRSSNLTPDRDTNGALANLAVALPDTLQIGLVVYSNTAAHDVRMFAQEFRVRTPA